MSNAVAITKTLKDYQFTKEELDDMEKGAYKTEDYRYILTRVWNNDLPRMVYILLNPSTADHMINDPTAKKCMGFAKGLGYGSIEVVNLYAYKTPKPKILLDEIKESRKNNQNIINIIGAENDKFILAAVKKADLIVLGWGNNAAGLTRYKEVLQLLKGKELKCLEFNKSGFPKHPLFKKYEDIQDESDLLDYSL